MLLLMLFRTLFKRLSILVCVLFLASCNNAKTQKHKPRPIHHIEVMMHERANNGVPLLLEWVFVEDEKAYNAIINLKAEEFLESEVDLQNLYPRAIYVQKHTAFPGVTDILTVPQRSLHAKIILYAHFLHKGMNRWVVLPRDRIRVEVTQNTLKVRTVVRAELPVKK